MHMLLQERSGEQYQDIHVSERDYTGDDDDELLKVYCPSRRLLWSADPEARLVLLNHSVCVALCTALCQ